MGDLVLLEREIAPVMRRLAEGGIEVTALHNHLLRAQPATMYLHVAGHGDAARLATALRAALQESATPLARRRGSGLGRRRPRRRPRHRRHRARAGTRRARGRRRVRRDGAARRDDPRGGV